MLIVYKVVILNYFLWAKLSYIPVHYIYLNRLAHHNSLTLTSFVDLPRALALLDRLPSACAIILAACGPHLCVGIDLSSLYSITASSSVDRAAAGELLRHRTLALQVVVSVVEQCRKLVVEAIHDAYIGDGVDLVAAYNMW
ncbi:delta(3,5)-Delta(2,4)-dienoyl-CoA isomerase, peroxisomal [Canna indica]|uniref:Delta(3,5)-Delta(2,4)-dienoyl-CoA isomerase, peroxisomal n=1 Tax=Canna indica TaxID=4628 RepID=A0AAQ3QSH2_9LILI|nr:delta(3,5)-Delta(2,4)-dienoyl-CoA isomerase, peroxisomal [Canna indica]